MKDGGSAKRGGGRSGQPTRCALSGAETTSQIDPASIPKKRRAQSRCTAFLENRWTPTTPGFGCLILGRQGLREVDEAYDNGGYRRGSRRFKRRINAHNSQQAMMGRSRYPRNHIAANNPTIVSAVITGAGSREASEPGLLCEG